MPNQRIVVANYNFEYLDMIQQILQDEGYHSVSCVTTSHALDTIQHQQPGLVLMDINEWPKPESWELLNNLLQDQTTAHIPILLCSSNLQFSEEQQYLIDTGHVSIIEKPFDIDVLIDCIARIIGRPQPNITH